MKLKNLKTIFLVLLIISILANIFQFRYFQKTNSENSYLINRVVSLKDHLIKHTFSEGIKLSPKLKVNFMDDTILVTDLLRKPKLFFRFTNFDCSKCIEDEVSIIKIFQDQPNRDKLIVLCAFESMRELVLFKRMNGFHDISVFNILGGGLELPLEIEQKPFFFISDSTLMTRCIYIPEFTDTTLSLRYFQAINKLL